MSTAQIICLVLCGSAIAIALTNIIYLIATRPESFKRDKRNDDTNNRDHKTKDSDIMRDDQPWAVLQPQERRRSVNPKINIFEMPQTEAEYLARQTLRAVERYFARPGVQEVYEKWLEERKKGRTPHETI